MRWAYICIVASLNQLDKDASLQKPKTVSMSVASNGDGAHFTQPTKAPGAPFVFQDVDFWVEVSTEAVVAADHLSSANFESYNNNIDNNEMITQSYQSNMNPSNAGSQACILV